MTKWTPLLFATFFLLACGSEEPQNSIPSQDEIRDTADTKLPTTEEVTEKPTIDNTPLNSAPVSIDDFLLWLPNDAFSLTTLTGEMQIGERRLLIKKELPDWTVKEYQEEFIEARNDVEQASFTIVKSTMAGREICFFFQNYGQATQCDVFEFDSNSSQLKNVSNELPKVLISDFIHLDNIEVGNPRFDSSDYVSLYYDRKLNQVYYTLDRWHLGMEIETSIPDLNLDEHTYDSIPLLWDLESFYLDELE